MRKLASVLGVVFFMAVIAATPQQATAAPIFTGVSNDPSPRAECENFTCGVRLTATRNLTITRLGAYDRLSDGLSGAATVGLWTQNGTLLASATLPAGASGDLIDGYRYADIGAVALLAGSTYVLGAGIELAEFDVASAVGGVGVTVDAAVSLDVGVYRSGAFGFPDIVDADRQFLAANMISQSNVVASPGPLLLLLTGLIGLVAIRRTGQAKA